MNVIDWINMFALAVSEENAAGAGLLPPRQTVRVALSPPCWPITTSSAAR